MAKTSINRIQLFLRLLLFVLVMFAVGYSVYDQDQVLENMFLRWRVAIKDGGGTIALVMLMVFLNWGFEALKWKKLIQNVRKLTFFQAYKGVLTGVGLAFITPRDIGDYFGRILQLKVKGRAKVVGALVVGRGMQLLATLLFGVIGLVYYTFHEIIPLDEKIEGMGFVAMLLFMIILLGLVFRKSILNQLENVSLFKKGLKLLTIIRGYTYKSLFEVFLLSMLRYMIFLTQFILIFYLFGYQGGLLEVVSGISLVFLSKSVVPALNIASDLGVRELTALYFISPLGVSADIILTASLSLWVINILVPTFVGGILALKIKLSIKE